MISSLANFLMLVLYHGGHPGRVSWTLLMFTMGAVGIARVAIEKDRMYSLGYAGILGLVTFASMLKFVDSPIFSAAILVVIAYLADRIVRDCTLIDDDVDASGQGLIDSGRLFVRKKVQTPEVAVVGFENSDASSRKLVHQPGRTVMYLAMGALPLFGLGQFFLREDPATWDRAQKLLAFYLFASLSLLVTTSFLGLRRYLRQRKVEMPADVSVAWLAGGLALVALILFIAFMAPVPGELLASFELPKFLDSPGDTVASKSGSGEDAADKTSEGAATTSEDKNSADKEVEDITAGENAPPGDVGDGKRDDGPTGKQKGDKPSQSGDPESGEPKSRPSEQKSDQSKPEGSKPDDSKPPGNSPKSDSNSESQPNESDKPSSDKPNPDESNSKDDPKSKAEPPTDQSEQKNEEIESKQDSQPPKNKSNNSNPATGKPKSSGSPPPNPAESIANSLPALSDLLKFVIFISLAVIVGFFVWAHRHAISLWWSQLFERDAPANETTFDEFLAAETRVPPRSFSSFTNPIGRENDPRRVIVITFAAWEAWCREQGISRSREETPSEFLARTAKASGVTSAPTRRLVDAYNRIVYGRGNASQDDVAAASEVWGTMR
ncbi:hypothetical protein Poly59_37600 [Rubripirellula reticaptiva]|uniref:Protein-glutamine gamma-glutamyltransferase-like C-terminal domain-containing protein n=2 Tax=Rubripirellula reticaptiva TaxID=2528013 RepID=A0A5C6ENH5_9BACT|nr:hypothetical protein Poly59_37600 [Rubripirellula reticaptiva]